MMNNKSGDNLMNDILIGFEIEMVFCSEHEYRPDGLHELKKRMIDIFKDKKYKCVINEYGPTQYKKKTIYITDDWSIKATGRAAYKFFKDQKAININIKGLYSVELLSPVLPMAEAIEFYKRISKKLFDTKLCYMNKSCGLHINVSHANRRDNIKLDIVKVLSTFNINKWRKIFKREHNQFCRTMPFNKWVLNRAIAKKNMAEVELKKDMDKKSSFKKYSAIAIHNWELGRRKTSRIEWRISGGESAMDYKLVKSMIKDISKSMWNGLTNRVITRKEVIKNLLTKVA